MAEAAKAGAAISAAHRSASSRKGSGPGEAGASLALPAPRATYRFQFHAGFTFDDAVAVLPYLVKLGVSHVYSSPIQKARPGSTHGYDVVDHGAINPELGGEAGFYRLSDALRRHGLGLILDIVPNHMGVGGADNADWLSVLEWGSASPAAPSFDIDWERLGAGGKLVLPVLDDHYGNALEKGGLVLCFSPEDGSFSIRHHEHRLPLCPLSYPLILERALAALERPEGQAAIFSLSDRLRAMQEDDRPERRADFLGECEVLKRELAARVAASPPLAEAIERAVRFVNGVPGMPESFGTLHRILEQQSYRAAHWRVAASDVNYRRFFDINALAGLRVEDAAVFQRTHDPIIRLVDEERIQGLRIDHVDGLADPEAYLETLQAKVGPGFYVVVEKILEPEERLRPWPISGTTGYDVLNLIDGLLVPAENAGRMEAVYRTFSGFEGRYFDQLRAAKTEILQSSFASELEVLVQDLKRIADADRRTRDFTAYGIRIALSEIIARFPVYRSYLTDAPPSQVDIDLVQETIAGAKRHSALPDRSVHDFAADCLLGRIETSAPGRPSAAHVAGFRRRFQQLTGPVMAKSLEDTLFYRYARLIALNEVGGDPAGFGVSVEHFHEENARRARLWPNAMIATATHDTKRGEDARARLLCLAEIPEAWEEALGRFGAMAHDMTTIVGGEEAPDRNDQVIVLQTILGAWPPELLDDDDPAMLAEFEARLHGFAEKAAREAKRHTSWVNIDEGYETSLRDFVSALVTPGSAFLAAFRPLARRLAEGGLCNGLVRTALKLTLPGIPDIYQGTSFWDFSLVDPDNRRPVDYGQRIVALEDGRLPGDFAGEWRDGRVKQALIATLLADRAAHPGLYAKGGYRPLGAAAGRDVVAFGRQADGEELVCAARRFVLSGDISADCRIDIPAGLWREILTGREIDVPATGLESSSLLGELPVAVLRRQA